MNGRALIRLLICSSIIFGMFSCQDEATNLVELDLLSYGMPIVIQAPPDAIVEKMDLVVSNDITVKKDDFFVQIFESAATSRDLTEIKSRLLGEVQGNQYFQKVMQEDPDGFVYETAIDSSYINYGFRRARIQGDKEYVFQTGLRGKFTLEQVQTMYDAVAKP